MVNDDNPTTELNDSKLAHINNENIDKMIIYMQMTIRLMPLVNISKLYCNI